MENNKYKESLEVEYQGIRRPMDSVGRIVLPKEMRQYFNLTADSEIEIFQTSRGILIRPVIQTGSRDKL